MGSALAAAGAPKPTGSSAPGAAAVPPPVVERLGDGRLTVGLPGELLQDPALVRQLESGLTTSLLVRLTARDPARRKATAVAHVDVRFELWDEVFLLHAFGGDGRAITPAPKRLAGRDALASALPALGLPLALAPPLERGAPWSLEVTLEVVPFSLAEQRDAQRWFSDTVASQRGSASEVGGESGSGGAGLGRLVDLVMATSLDRRAVRRFVWSLEVPPP
jgi:hypothetical protein